MTLEVSSATSKITEYAGSFAPNGSSAVSADSYLGSGFTVERTGVGTFVVTLDPQVVFVQLVAAAVKLHMGTPTGAFATMTTFTAGDAGNFTIKTIAPTLAVDFVGETSSLTYAAADVAAHASNRIDFVFKVRATVGAS